MAAELTRHLRLVGESETAGGEFGRLRITGDATFVGDVDCDKLSITGTVRVKGSLAFSDMTLTGNAEVHSSLRGGSIRGLGELHVAGHLRAGTLRISGHLDAGGAVEADRIDLRGGLTAKSMVNADEVAIRLYGPSIAKEVVGEQVSIRRSRGMMLKGLFQPGKLGGMAAELIEGDRVYLEHTRAQVVRGTSVKLGPGCDIGRVEYRGTLEKHAKSKVDAELRI
ncbi:hypothetical protein [Paenibacillus soyae]|uniref:Polymer-forming cytoskeletal protein n=1 Tax=Paenibacillus soyae TaxID=2969249 RepID=A0A9X2MV86_9BACL|nr:hypothetical protein [Paenibacillus soyae]MCR2804177.1 hypothetical protein [Paenibacillus soyae]